MCGAFVSASGSRNDIFSYRNIYRCYLACRKNKRTTANALKFELNAEENIFKLEQELKAKTYHPSRSLLFVAQKPKRREIFAAAFRDRIVHHILVDRLERIWEPIFIHDSYACRRKKGTHKAVDRLQGFLRRITKNGRRRTWYLQLDVKDFFTAIDKDILFGLIKKKVKDEVVLWLARTVIFWDCTTSYEIRGSRRTISSVPLNKSLFGKRNEKGLPIGNLTSQFFANLYLNELDQFVKHTLKAHYYLRYTDDFVLLSTDRKELEKHRGSIEEFLKTRLALALHPKRRKLAMVSGGIDFLGYIVRQNYKLVRRRVVNNFRRKIKNGRQGNFDNVAASYKGHFKHANAYRLQKSLRII